MDEDEEAGRKGGSWWMSDYYFYFSLVTNNPLASDQPFSHTATKRGFGTSVGMIPARMWTPLQRRCSQHRLVFQSLKSYVGCHFYWVF